MPIQQDSVLEGVELFTATLSPVPGPVGVLIGEQGEATATIIDDDSKPYRIVYNYIVSGSIYLELPFPPLFPLLPPPSLLPLSFPLQLCRLGSLLQHMRWRRMLEQWYCLWRTGTQTWRERSQCNSLPLKEVPLVCDNKRLDIRTHKYSEDCTRQSLLLLDYRWK